MANTLLTPDMITREALRILHQEMTFISTINRDYDNSFAGSGGKIGDTLRIRLPNQYTVRTGAVMQTQDTTETNTTLVINNQKGVDMSFSSTELTLDIDNFSERYIRPAMSVLAAAIEADALSMTQDVWNVVANTGAAIDFDKVLQARRKLSDDLAPEDGRYALLNTNDSVKIVDALKGLFQDQTAVASQFRKGHMGKAAGFTFSETTHLTTQARGAGSGYVTNAVTAQTGDSLIVDTGTGAINKGEVFTIAGVFRVHPETKVNTGILQQFVVTETYAGGNGTIKFAPAIVASGARQNVTNGAANDQNVTIIGTASTAYGQSLVYHKDAFTFATADLVLPDEGFRSRQTFDGISMRIVRKYDINNDLMPCRIDVLYGYKSIRPQLAARMANLAPTA